MNASHRTRYIVKCLQGSVALLGDACHPSVPYAASGAAMAVEDGVVLGRLLGQLCECGYDNTHISDLLKVYETLRKQRNVTVRKLAEGNGQLYHMVDGPEQQKRDRMLGEHDWWDDKRSFPWVFGDLPYLHELYGFDTLKSADEAFARWCDGSAAATA